MEKTVSTHEGTVDDTAIITRIRELKAEGLALRAIADRLHAEGGPKLDPKTIAARLRTPVEGQLDHIAPELRSLAMPCESLRFDPRNPNSHPEAQKAALRASLKEFGQLKPIVANTHQGNKPIVIAGNATLEAALALGWTHIAVNRVNVSDTIAKAYAAADKRTADMSVWDSANLAAILMELEDEPIDMAALGFDDDFVRQAVEAAQGVEPEEGGSSDDGGGGDGDELPDEPKEDLRAKWNTAQGQIWEITGKQTHRVMCGDSTSAEDVAALMKSEAAGLCFTSPPYAQQRQYTQESTELLRDWDALMSGVFRHLPMAPDGQVLVNLGMVHRDGEYIPYWDDWIEWMRSQGWKRFGWYVWDKGYGMPGASNGRLAVAHEFIWHFCKEPKPAIKARKTIHAGEVRTTRGQRGPDGRLEEMTHVGAAIQDTALHGSVFRVHPQGSAASAHGHPAPYPADLPAIAIQSWDGIVYDPFLGSGTTLIAAEREGRPCRGMEISLEYVAIILERATKAGMSCKLMGVP